MLSCVETPLAVNESTPSPRSTATGTGTPLSVNESFSPRSEAAMLDPAVHRTSLGGTAVH